MPKAANSEKKRKVRTAEACRDVLNLLKVQHQQHRTRSTRHNATM